ncbi:glycosyl transferase [Leptospira yasudae]|uniref:glycosyltransferase family A protein n=1 Tax=Leptospira yasudae TaxID=2202201 RepID=UPI000E59A2FB|nr:glycosyltransferase family A protein [Leptospira yasudae]RHX91216.1 glycosyl transferase [Leptospira yasudae]
MKLAPIALFVYNRPQHTKITIEALLKNGYADKSELFVFCDGPKNDSQLNKINEVRAVAKNVVGFKSVTIIEKEQNNGLANSIISGVSELIEKYGKVIVLEDDMTTSPFFLTYMNQALEKYESEDRVISIHGYRLPIHGNTPETFFLRGADCWGWGTWKRGWDLFERDGQRLLNELYSKKITYDFDMKGAYPYTQMLTDQVSGKNDSWAIRWHASAFLRDKLTLYPARSLILNIGLDTSGTHCEATDEFDVELSRVPIRLETIKIEENLFAKNLFRDYYRNRKRRLISEKITKLFHRYLHYLTKPFDLLKVK